MRIVSSALNSGKSREGAIVPATTITTTTKGCFFSGWGKDSRTNRERETETHRVTERETERSVMAFDLCWHIDLCTGHTQHIHIQIQTVAGEKSSKVNLSILSRNFRCS